MDPRSLDLGGQTCHIGGVRRGELTGSEGGKRMTGGKYLDLITTMKSTLFAALAFSCTAWGEDGGGKQSASDAWGVLSKAVSGGGIWEGEAGQIAEELGMHQEMEDGRSRRHIVYPEQRWKGAEFRILGLEPRAVLLTEGLEDGKPRRIRVVFGNRGDDMWGIYKGESPEDRPVDIFEAKRTYGKQMKDAVKGIDRDAQEISRILTDLYGAGGWARARRDLDTGETRKWWQGDGFRVELIHSKGTITAVDITEGKEQSPDVRSTSPNSVTSVKREDNGDVFVDGIPEVHQGDKPYCSAASLERLFRLLSVDVDQYELGAAVGSGETQIGSGWRKLVDKARGLARRHRINVGEVSIRGISQIAQHIDKGTPLMWCQRSTPDLTNMFWKLDRNREELSPPDRKREKNLGGEATKALAGGTGVHACLVVGYNERTEEIAISNTWQGKSGLLWIPFEVFQAADSKASLFYLKGR